MNPASLINGQPADKVEVLDRGLQYGDGLFETLAVKEGQPQLWDRHMERLREGCRRLHLPAPDPILLRDEAAMLCSGAARAVLKIILTRGAGARGYRIQPGVSATRILTLSAAADYPEHYYRDGVTVRLCATPLARNPVLAGIKHLNRLEQVLARAEWDDARIAEGLMCDPDGYIIEGTMSNLFLVRSGALAVPRLDACGVAGVMRASILAWARGAGVAVQERPVTPADLKAADEAFLCNSLIGVWPIRRCGETALRRGPLTARVLAAVGRYSLMPASVLAELESEGARTAAVHRADAC